MLELSDQPTIFPSLQELGAAQEVVAKHRRKGQGDQKRGQDGDHIGNAQRSEKPPLHPAQKEKGQEHQNHDEGGKDNGISNLARSSKNNAQGRLRVVLLAILAKSPEDVFDIHDGIIHQLPNGNGQASQHHGVDADSEEFHHHRGDQKGERDGGQGDGCGSEVQQEEKQDDDHQYRSISKRLNHVVDRR